MQAQCSWPALRLAGILLATSLSAIPSGLHAQGVTSTLPNDYYRAEFVILQRLVDPAGIAEQMSDKAADTADTTGKALWVEDSNGSRRSDLNLAPRQQLHLGEAANRLERSGNYRVLATAGWYEAFPPNYKGQPLQVAIGDWLPEAGQRSVEGTITIDRQRYLHVNVSLNHWAQGENPAPEQPAPEATTAPGTQAGMLPPEPGTPPAAAQQAELALAAYQPTKAPVELITWIRETRRMRSEEIHFIDSPTIGVLVFFKKIGG